MAILISFNYFKVLSQSQTASLIVFAASSFLGIPGYLHRIVDPLASKLVADYV